MATTENGHCKVCGKKIRGKWAANINYATCSDCCEKQNAEARRHVSKVDREAREFWQTWCA